MPATILTKWAAMGAAAMSLMGPALADPIADFYRGKTVTVFAGTTAGGTYDLYARTIARHLGAHLPGSPTVIVQNRPGAASLVAASTAGSMPGDMVAMAVS